MAGIKIGNLDDLKKIIATSSISETVNSYILGNEAVCFNVKSNLTYELKKSLSSHFDIHLKNIEIVGSAKLGISLNPSPERYGKKFDSVSDIDLVIVSSELFDIAWHELIRKEEIFLTKTEKDQLSQCYSNIPMGIISPNQLPAKMDFSKKWWAIFNSLSSRETKFENRKIRGRLFKNWWFVEKYYSKQLARLSSK